MFSSLKKLSISQRNVRIAYISNVISMFMLIMPIRTLWMQQTLSNAQISIVIGLIFFSTLILELPTGAFADLVGKKRTVQMGHISYVFAILAYLLATNFWQFLVAAALQGLAESLRSGARDALIFDSLAQDGREKEFKTVFSKLVSSDQISMVVATFVGGWLGGINMRLPFLIFAICLLIAAVLSSLFIEPDVDTEKFTLKNYLKQTRDGTKQIFKNSRVAKMAILYMFVGGISWAFQRLLRDMLLIDVGYGAVAIGIIVGFSRLFNILFLGRLIKSTKINSGAWDILFIPALMAVSYLSAFYLNKITSIPIIAGIMMTGTGRFFLLNPYLQHEVESKYRATAMSAANFLVCLFLSVNLFTLGFVLEKFSITQVTIFFGFVSLLTVLPLAEAVRREYRE